jgi:DNA-binding Lrp family transcriptional regulator
MSTNTHLLLSDIDRALLDNYQHDFPVTERPFAAIAAELDISESQVIEHLRRLKQLGALSRVGPVLRPNRIGASTLAALAVPTEHLEKVAELVSALPEVNHNYEREHEYNLWFVITAANREQIDSVLAEIEARTGLPALDLPMQEDYFIDLGFSLKWQ